MGKTNRFGTTHSLVEYRNSKVLSRSFCPASKHTKVPPSTYSLHHGSPGRESEGSENGRHMGRNRSVGERDRPQVAEGGEGGRPATR